MKTQHKKYRLFDKKQQTFVCVEGYTQWNSKQGRYVPISRVATGAGRAWRFRWKIDQRSLDSIKKELGYLVKSKRKKVIDRLELKCYTLDAHNNYQDAPTCSIKRLAQDVEKNYMMELLKG